MSGRWKLGDVMVWFSTGTEQDARTDADVLLSFSTPDGGEIGWVRAYERGDKGGFEEGDTNLGFVGNLNKQTWLKTLIDSGTLLDVKIETENNEDGWFLESISLDFRVGPVVDVSTVRTWSINEWIRPDDKFHRYEADSELQSGAGLFEEVGFEKELEIESGTGPVAA